MSVPRPSETPADWTPASWQGRPIAQEIHYDDATALATALEKLGSLPPLVTSWEVERLRGQLADAQVGKRFVLQGGDCAETFADCRSTVIANKLKILLQMSLVLIHGGQKPIVRIGRFAGQYGKPRSKPTETFDGVTLPSYFGDLVNRPDFTAAARRPDPNLLVTAYEHAAMTLNFVRSLSAGGFADLHHPEYWDLSFFERSGLTPELRGEYQRTSKKLADALHFMEALGERAIDDLTRVEFFTSHEAIHLHYESAQTRHVPRRSGSYDLTTHLPWIGERTRSLDGAHVEFFRGVRNPVGVKVGPTANPEEIAQLVQRLNPFGEPGKVALITRLGAGGVEKALPPLAAALTTRGLQVLWICDPMHGNTRTTTSGIKTRRFDDILLELELTFDVHQALGSHLGGVHFELTGEDVTECLGAGIGELDLARSYETLCDPRLNYAQALELAFRIAERIRT